jgi:hypothetical protein
MRVSYESIAVCHLLTSRIWYMYFLNDPNQFSLIVTSWKKKYPTLTQVFFCKNHEPCMYQNNKKSGELCDLYEVNEDMTSLE